MRTKPCPRQMESRINRFHPNFQQICLPILQHSSPDMPNTISPATFEKHFSCITETAVHLSTFKWVFSQPGHGHFLKASNLLSIKFEPVIVCDTDQNSCNMMQMRYSLSFIFGSLNKMASLCVTKDLPFIQGYYIHLD